MLLIYSKNHCPQCDKAKSLLNQKNIKYEEIKIDEDTNARQFLINAGHKSVPQIYKGAQLLVEGGYNGLAKLSDSDFKQLLEG